MSSERELRERLKKKKGQVQDAECGRVNPESLAPQDLKFPIAKIRRTDFRILVTIEKNNVNIRHEWNIDVYQTFISIACSDNRV
jgi:hypothetical protein